MTIRWLPLIRDVLIIMFATFIGGFAAGFTAEILKLAQEAYLLTLGLTNILFGIIGFVVVGLLTVTNRWRHLAHVMIGVWIVSIVNIFFGASFIEWVMAIVFLAIMGVVGGGIATLIRPEPR